MKLRVVGGTRINPYPMLEVSSNQWNPEDCGPGTGEASAMAEFSGRACYQAWRKQNPATAENQGYLAHILEERHFSILEHGSISFHVEGVSRSLTHELIRHRHFSFSQQSQRYVVTGVHAEYVVPPLFYNDTVARDTLQKVWEQAMVDYDTLIQRAEWLLGDQGVPAGTARRKRAREAARAVLPNMTPTSIVVTGNHRSWREFLEKRGSIHADAEIRELALRVFQLLRHLETNIYQDFKLEIIDGQECVVRA